MKQKATTNTAIKSALRKLWLRSRERAAALKREEYTCEICGKKQSRAKGKEVKIEVHHKKGILNWDHIFKSVRKNLLCDPKHLQVLCRKCHKELNK